MSRHRQANKQTRYLSGNHARVADLFTTKRCGLLILLAVGILARPAWQVLQSYGLIKTTETQLRQMINLEGSIMYRDEVLTMSANMAAATAEMKWANRYAEFGQRTRPEVEKNWSISENKDIGEEAILAGFASDKLATMENKALELVHNGKQNEAMALLQSQEYSDQKNAYNRGMKTFVSRVRSTLEDRRDKYWKKVRNVFMAMSGILPAIILVWLVALRAGEHIYSHATTKHKISSFAREWQETFNAISDGVCIIDRNGGKILQCNKAMTRFLKRPYNEIIGQSCCELLHGSSEPVKKCPLMRMLGTRRSETMDFQVGDRWLNIKVDPLIDNEGHLVGAVHILSDITEHRKAIKALRESENKFRLAFANAQDAIIWIEGETGVITNCNKSAEELFGKGKKEILGQHHTTLYPEDKAEHHQNLLSEFCRDTNSSIEAEIIRRGGEIRTVTIALSTMSV
jgi:PAS domain S-box-containing protein